MILKTPSLPNFLLAIIRDKGTERPFSGVYTKVGPAGTYLCRQCGLALFYSQHQFQSSCGWPSFDEEVTTHVRQQPDPDGERTEILCKRCQAHLGHVFYGEGYTTKNIRHCVNSLSLDFVPYLTEDSEEVILAGGCFWGVQHLLNELPGVLKTEVGYIGGQEPNPTYELVCSGQTDYIEAVRVIYDPTRLDFKSLVKYFLEIHDPTDGGGQGPDRGKQYLSRIFYYDQKQKSLAESLLQQLREKGYSIATSLQPVSPFWAAEPYHQHYYQTKGDVPYCHRYEKRFD